MYVVNSVIYFKGKHIPQDIILQSIHRYLAYPLTYRQIEEMMTEGGGKIDHSAINRWVFIYAPQLEKAFRAPLLIDFYGTLYQYLLLETL